MRIAVTGAVGQLVLSLLEQASDDVEVIALGRPMLDLTDAATIGPALAACRPDIIVNAAAYTAVDKAELEPAIAMAANGYGAGHVADAAARLGVPVIQISTDYVFDGTLDRPYVEDDTTGPIGHYGKSKLAGEHMVAAATPNHVILRTAWVYSPFGNNFVKTMLRLAETRDTVSVVADQIGSPTSALDIATAVLAVARNVLAHPDKREMRGIFHVSGDGEASWADVAQAIFAQRERATSKAVQVNRITTADYPTPAKRPANSRLNCAKLATVHGVRLPHWSLSLKVSLDRLLNTESRS